MVGIIFLSLNRLYKFIALPEFLLSAMLVIGALLFFADAMHQRETGNKKTKQKIH